MSGEWYWCVSCNNWIELGPYDVVQSLPRGQQLVVERQSKLMHKILVGKALQRQTLKTPPPEKSEVSDVQKQKT